MLLIVLAVIWVALLAPVVIRRLREGGTEKSIQSFERLAEAVEARSAGRMRRIRHKPVRNGSRKSTPLPNPTRQR